MYNAHGYPLGLQKQFKLTKETNLIKTSFLIYNKSMNKNTCFASRTRKNVKQLDLIPKLDLTKLDFGAMVASS